MKTAPSTHARTHTQQAAAEGTSNMKTAPSTHAHTHTHTAAEGTSKMKTAPSKTSNITQRHRRPAPRAPQLWQVISVMPPLPRSTQLNCSHASTFAKSSQSRIRSNLGATASPSKKARTTRGEPVLAFAASSSTRALNAALCSGVIGV